MTARLIPWLALGALLAGCGAPPARPPWTVEPLMRVEHGGDAADALYRLGRYHQQRGEAAAADDAFARAIALRPDRLDARNARAVLLAGEGRQAEAVELLRQLAAQFPHDAQPLNNLGYLYYLQGRTGPARAAIEQALRIDPQHAQARANLARMTPAPGAAATTPAATVAAAPTQSTTPAADDGVARARWQVVALAPNEFSLQAVAAAPAAASPAPAAAASNADDGNRHGDGGIQIVNGNGVRGLGERTRRLLASGALPAAADADVVNQRGHHQRDTIIEYLPGQRERAVLVRAALKGRAKLLPARALPAGLALRVVLGRDHAAPDRAAKAAAPKRLPDAALLTMNSAAPHFNQE
ncbi:Tetratricopeptide repeat-containing protein [Duganella sp. CF517]|uniref:LytR C-terminal domain-containing protein n=1 Tax=Duganella sp. CF517 TaxID=1881038 RepID=UPI0008C5C7F0|nr:LytR C-terminal domain-containing protein [Duganella sp. CF517]SEO20729.1 Tetratricopeptide repeat-containing protein [Duganella sp. CF517]